MSKFKVISAILLLFIIGYGILADREELLPYVLVGTAVLMLISGIQELGQKKNKWSGYLYIVSSSVFFLFGSTYFFL
ncbi:MAG: hypothetical protein N2C11_07745 [Planococcus sp. (in: firmicutes)]